MFGDNLKKYRTEKGFSQNDLAEKLFVSRQCVSKWEKGTTEPDLQTLTQISEILEVSVDELLKEDNSAPSPVKKPENKNTLLFIVNIMIAVFCTIAFVVLFRFMPQTIPAHWAANGQIDRYGKSSEILINIVTTIVFFIADLIVFFAVKKYRDKRVIYISHGIIILFQIAYLIFIFALYAEYLSNILSFVTCMTADLILCVSVMMYPKINKQNELLGIRTSDTLNSEFVWNKANALACYLFTGSSLIILIVNMILIFPLAYLCFLVYVILTIIVIVYSKIIKKAAP